MAVRVVLAHLDRGDERRGALEQRGQPLVGAAVMGDLERLDARQIKSRGDVGLRVGRQQQVERAVPDDGDERIVVRVAVRTSACCARRRPEHLHAQLADAQRLPGARGDRAAADALERCRKTALDRRRPASAAVEHQPRSVRGDHR